MRTLVLLTACLLLGSGCVSTAVSGAVSGFTDQLGSAILDSDDPETVRAGAPSYLLLIDALVAGEPENPAYLATSARLHGAYAGAFVDDPARRVRFATKALDLSARALCVTDATACGLREKPIADVDAWLASKQAADVGPVYDFAVAWAGFIQANSEDWNAVAELERVRHVMDWVVRVAPAHDNGGAHLYLGVMGSLVPAAMGGRPEEAKAHFEQAIALSEGKHLMTKVMYARTYARSVYDRELHDRLLAEVAAADPRVRGMTLVNVIAQREAAQLAASADDYF